MIRGRDSATAGESSFLKDCISTSDYNQVQLESSQPMKLSTNFLTRVDSQLNLVILKTRTKDNFEFNPIAEHIGSFERNTGLSPRDDCSLG